MICETLNCVGLTQSSVIQIIHRNVGLNSFFVYLNICYYHYFFLTFIFSSVYDFFTFLLKTVKYVLSFIILRLHDQANIKQTSSKRRANVKQ